MTPAPFLLAALVLLAAGILLGARRPRLWLVSTAVAAASGLAAALFALLGGEAWEWRGAFLLGGQTPHLRLDALAAVFLALLAVVGGAGAVYANGYWTDLEQPRSAPRGRAWWSAMLLAMGLVLTVSNGLHFLVAWELFAVCGYPLLTLDRDREAARSAGRLYLMASHTGTMLLVAFFVAWASRTGSFDLGPVNGRGDMAPLFWLALVGFGLKAGLFPLHVWLPSAHANAPSHVSALMSGVAIKMGVYGLFRFSGWMPVPDAAGYLLLGLGGASALLGIAFALAQDDVKRLLAYCSVENVGLILVGLGGALLAAGHGQAVWGRLLLAGALLHVWNHGLFKALLFLGAGSVLHVTGTREMSRLGGLWSRMPVTVCLFLLGALAASGMPPLNGFVGEWLIYLGLFDAAGSGGGVGWAAMLAAVAIGTAVALALASFVKAGTLIFLGAPRTRAAAHAHECGYSMRAPMSLLGGLCLAIGVVPALLWPLLSGAVAVWHPVWAAVEAPPPLRTLGLVHAALAALAAVAALLLVHRARANGVGRGPTWDCGYASPGPRMQYTSGSFGGLAAGWFGWILRPRRRAKLPHGPFPLRAVLLEETPDVVLARVLDPAAGALLRVSTEVRRLQHGRVQSYLVYVLVGLLGLALLVGLGRTHG